MKSLLPPLLAFTILLLVLIISFSLPAQVVPGWHTRVYPSYFLGFLAIGISLPFIAIGYWLFRKKATNLYWMLYVVHFLITMATIVYILFPYIFLVFNYEVPETYIRATRVREALIPEAVGLLIAAQLLFAFYLMRVNKGRHALARVNNS